MWSIVAGLLASVFLMILKDSYFSSTKYDTPTYSLLFISGSLLTTYFSSLFFAKKNFIFPQLIQAITNFFIVVFGVALYLMRTEKDHITLLVTIYFVSYMVNGILLGIIYFSKYNLTFVPRWPAKSNIRKLLRYSIFAFVTNIVAFLAYRIDYWILKAFSPKIISAIALGNYIQVSKLVQLFLFAPTIIASIVFPVSASGVDINFHKQLRKMFSQALLLNTVGCVLLLFAGRWLFVFFYGKSFSLMYMCFIFSIPAILAITVVRIAASYFAGTNRMKYNLAGGLIALTVIAFLNYLLIPLMGINGSALADSAGYISYLTLLIFFLNRDRN